MNTAEPIDVVITWVDGNDPKHKLKMKPFLKDGQEDREFQAAPTRFCSVGEIFYCVASIFRFAPFVRKIFLVTDDQNPQLDAFLALNFPDRVNDVQIVDHKEIFRGYEEHLPMFSSRGIESCLFRIKGLSENFVCFNDDFLLVRPIQIQDWYRKGKMYAETHWAPSFPIKLLSKLKPLKNGVKPYGFKDSMVMTAKLLGFKLRYLQIYHVPHPCKKSLIAAYHEEHPDLLASNAAYHFRSERQYSPQVFCYLLAYKKGLLEMHKGKHRFIFLKPNRRKKHYVERKIREFNGNTNICFACVGSLDLAYKSDQDKIFSWLKELLSIQFPA